MFPIVGSEAVRFEPVLTIGTNHPSFDTSRCFLLLSFLYNIARRGLVST